MIKSNTCPYCDGHYHMTEGCVNRCRLSIYVANLVAAAADADEGEVAEVEGRQ